MISLSDLITPVTTDQQEAVFLSALTTVGLPANSWVKGGALRTIIRVVAATYAGFSNLMVQFAQGAYLGLSSGGWLTLLAYYVYGVTRIPAAFATGNITLTNSGGGVYALNPGQLSVYSPTTGQVYTNTSAFTLNATSSLSVPVQAVTIGSVANALPATITAFQTVLAGVTVTNPAAINGADQETDAALTSRCSAKLGTISGLGPRGAYGYAIRSAQRSDGSYVNVNRSQIIPSSTTGVITIYVASTSGAPVSSDLPYIVSSIELYARPDSVTVSVLAANPVALTPTLTVWATQTSGLAAADLATLVSNALNLAIQTYPIGGVAKTPSTQGYLYRSTVEGIVKAAHPSIFAVDGFTTDQIMSPGDVITMAATVNVRIITQVT